jgi:hypothetical protein
VCRGEETARTLERNLTSLERKLDELLAGFEEGERRRLAAASGREGQEVKEGKEGKEVKEKADSKEEKS